MHLYLGIFIVRLYSNHQSVVGSCLSVKARLIHRLLCVLQGNYV